MKKRIADRWGGDAGRSAATAAATSRARPSMRRVGKGISSICSGADFPAPTRPASEP